MLRKLAGLLALWLVLLALVLLINILVRTIMSRGMSAQRSP